MKTLPPFAVQFYTKDDTARTISSDGSLADTQNAINYVAPRGQDNWILTAGLAGGSYGWTAASLNINIGRIFTLRGPSPTNRPSIACTQAVGFSVSLTNLKLLTIKDIIFPEWNTSDSSTLFQFGGSGVDTFRVTNCRFNHGSGSKTIRVGNSGGAGTLTLGAEGPYGLVDNCQCGNGAGFYFCEVGENWRRPMTFGTKKAFYVEDCTFTGSTIEYFTAVDAWNGARYVFRHNALTNMFIGNHGADSAGPLNSCLQVEAMHNTFSVNTGFDKAIFIRGGTGVFFSNQFNRTGQGFYNFGIKLSYFRAMQGTNTTVDRFYPQDYVGTMQPGSGYIGITGRDPKHPSEPWGSVPIYAWGNGGNAPRSYGDIGSGEPFNQLNRDRFVGTPKPGYIEYEYPHPLRGGGGGGLPADITSPTVSITSPANGATVSGTVAISVTAADEVGGSGLASVQYFVDGVAKFLNTLAPYSPYQWDSLTVPGGTHVLKVIARDNDGNPSEAQVSVTVNNPVAAISVDPQVLDWMEIKKDTAPADKTFTVLNVGGQGSLLSTSSPISVALPWTVQSGGTITNLPVNTPHTVTLRYRPTEQHQDSQQVAIATTGGNASVLVRGTSYTELDLTPNSAEGLISLPLTVADSNNILANGSFESDFTSWGGTGNRAIVTTGVSAGTKAVRFNVQGVCPRVGWSVHFVDSFNANPDRSAGRVYDGDNNTFWHTDYSNTFPNPTPPHTLDINLGASYNVSGFRILPRQDGFSNGRPAQYEFYVSADGATWGAAVSTGTLQDIATEQEIRFTPKAGQYIRFKAMTEVQGRAWTSIGELNVLHETTIVAGSLSQAFTTTPGATYTLQFDAGIDSVAGAEQRLQIGVQGTGVLLTQTALITALQIGVSYTPKSYTFVADSASTTITFTDVSVDSVVANLLLDNVRLTAPTTGSTISQPSTVTDPALGGRADYWILVPATADYNLSSYINDATGGKLAFTFDGEPVAPEMVWNVPPTTGLQLRVATWALDSAGSGSSVSKKILLTAGLHRLTIRVLKGGMQIGDIIISEVVAGTAPTIPTTPTPTGSNVEPSASLSVVCPAATTFDFYLDGVLVGEGRLSNVFQPQGLLFYSTTYSAKVIGHNTHGDSPPLEWDFTTKAAPAPEVPPNAHEPPDDAVNVPIDTLIKWGGGSGGYEVHFGTVDPPPLVSTQMELQYNPGPLAYDREYFREIKSGSTTSGILSFRTVAAPAPEPPDVPVVHVPMILIVRRNP